jgi:uncharacterized protein DUF5681
VSQLPAYRVGYGKPPEHTRFRKGRSGNPKGRPKRSENFARLARRTLNERIVVRENGERRSISKLEAVLKQLINKAATGDQRAIRDVIKLQPLIAQQDKAEDEKVVVNIVRWAKPGELGD